MNFYSIYQDLFTAKLRSPQESHGPTMTFPLQKPLRRSLRWRLHHAQSERSARSIQCRLGMTPLQTVPLPMPHNGLKPVISVP